MVLARGNLPFRLPSAQSLRKEAVKKKKSKASTASRGDAEDLSEASDLEGYDFEEEWDAWCNVQPGRLEYRLLHRLLHSDLQPKMVELMDPYKLQDIPAENIQKIIKGEFGGLATDVFTIHCAIVRPGCPVPRRREGCGRAGEFS